MNILAIDCAVSRLCVALKSDDKILTQILDVGMRQSEMLVPVIDQIMQRMQLKPSDLNASALTIGPGSFTGLRLGISALKAIELAYGVPVYGVSSLQAYAYPFADTCLPVLSCIDANKDKFYASITQQGSVILQEGDWETVKIKESVKPLEKVILTGPDAKKLHDILAQDYDRERFFTVRTHFDTAEALVEIAEDMIAQKKEPLKDYEGPVYLRASEAELKLTGQI